MTSFSAVNNDRKGKEKETTPTTPRPSTAPHPLSAGRADDAATPTRATFGSTAASTSQGPSAPPQDPITPTPTTSNSQERAPSSSSKNATPPSADNAGEETPSGSDSARSLGKRKKKKAQRFYCTRYPPCTLSFTRSEHLARHIRKHTGERPFKCHCQRTFSRLDNLRQHAQTVHINEEIPPDSLAATGTRFQKQVRTEKPRPRTRPPTTPGQTGPIRGHQRHASTPNMGSIYSPRGEDRRRPPPLAMAGGGNRQSGEIMYENTPQYPLPQYSPATLSFDTPTSTTYSTAQNSPRWPSVLPSPRSAFPTYPSPHTPNRRLSVPSGMNPFHSPHSDPYSTPPMAMGSLNSVMSPSNSVLASPGSVAWSRQASISGIREDSRRNTWAHPESYSSPIHDGYHPLETPPQRAAIPSNAPLDQDHRLPGIESFDQHRRMDLPHHPYGYVAGNAPSSAPFEAREPYAAEELYQDGRPTGQHWEPDMHNRYSTSSDTIQRSQLGFSELSRPWGQPLPQAPAEHAQGHPSQARFEEPYQVSSHQHHLSAPAATSREAKRQGGYYGPGAAISPSIPLDPRLQQTTPEGSSSPEGVVPRTPTSATVGDANPSIMHSSGYVEHRPAAQINGNITNIAASGQNTGYTYTYGRNDGQSEPQQQLPKPTDNSMMRLEALVAVATSEEHSNSFPNSF